MQLEESQLILFDLQFSVEGLAKSVYKVGGGSFQLIRLAVEGRRNSRVILFSWRRVSSFYSICSRVQKN